MIIIIIIISFMHGIYTYISETNYVPRENSVATILLLLLLLLLPPLLLLLHHTVVGRFGVWLIIWRHTDGNYVIRNLCQKR